MYEKEVHGFAKLVQSKTLSFNIAQRKISEKAGETGVLDNLSISMDGQIITKDMATGMEYLYTGYAIKPVVTIEDTGILQTGEGFDLVEGKDYSVSVSANTNAGTAKATISFKGSYSGKLVKTFKIVPWSLADATVTVDDVQYNNGKAANPVVTVTIDGDAVNPKSVKCTYFNNKNVTKPGEPEPYVVIKGASTKNIAGEVQKTFNVIEGDLSNAVISNISPQKFAGLAVTPKFTVSYNKTKLVEGRDYTVSYEKDSVPTNNKKGVAHITVTAVDGGNFTGETSTTFIIK